MAENNQVAAPPPKKGRLKTLILLVIILVLAIGLSIAGTLWFLGQGDNGAAGSDEAPAEEEAFVAADYMVMDKSLVSTIRDPGRQRYVQVFLAFEATEAEALEAASKHLPLLRNTLISELSRSEFTELQTVEGRQALPDRLLAVVNDTLTAEGEPTIDRVLFRNFVVQ